MLGNSNYLLPELLYFSYNFFYRNDPNRSKIIVHQNYLLSIKHNTPFFVHKRIIVT
jgi:hypothetical protein